MNWIREKIEEVRSLPPKKRKMVAFSFVGVIVGVVVVLWATIELPDMLKKGEGATASLEGVKDTFGFKNEETVYVEVPTEDEDGVIHFLPKEEGEQITSTDEEKLAAGETKEIVQTVFKETVGIAIQEMEIRENELMFKVDILSTAEGDLDYQLMGAKLIAGKDEFIPTNPQDLIIEPIKPEELKSFEIVFPLPPEGTDEITVKFPQVPVGKNKFEEFKFDLEIEPIVKDKKVSDEEEANRSED